MENQKYKYPHPSGCFGRILIPVWKGPCSSEGSDHGDGQNQVGPGALGRSLGKDELFWALRLRGCAERP